MDKKKISFAILTILQEETDENHILSTSDLIRKLNDTCHLKAERRTIYSDIALLKQEGFAISDYEENGQGYYMKGRNLSVRPFSRSEILLLCNAIHASHFIDQEESETLINKLLTMLSVHERETFREQVYLPNAFKSGSAELLDNIDQIAEACRSHHKIAFCYLHYDGNRNLIRNDHRYVVSPHYIVFHDERPYVIVTGRHPGISHYRIDRIANLLVTDEESDVLAEEDRQEAYQYAEDRLFMFAGEITHVRYRCENRIMNAMVDLFGKEVRTWPVDAEHFDMVIQTTSAGAVFLAQQYMDAIELMEPLPLREQVEAVLQKALKAYDKSI